MGWILGLEDLVSAKEASLEDQAAVPSCDSEQLPPLLAHLHHDQIVWQHPWHAETVKHLEETEVASATDAKFGAHLELQVSECHGEWDGQLLRTPIHQLHRDAEQPARHAMLSPTVSSIVCPVHGLKTPVGQIVETFLVGGVLKKEMHEFEEFRAGWRHLAQTKEQLPTVQGRTLRRIADQLLHKLNVDLIPHFWPSSENLHDAMFRSAALHFLCRPVTHPHLQISEVLNRGFLVGRSHLSQRLRNRGAGMHQHVR
mmetsp:Transcript_57279/g.152773  ORF Transcript_57279/g.152773 Transcript_57279/m.152773 type:complete len:256 (-) Transcript_57279:3742-4509(-)